MRTNYARGGLCWRCSWFRWSWSTLCHIESKQLIQVQASSVTVSNGKILIYKKIQSISEWHGKSLSWKMGSNSHLWQTEGFLQLGRLKGHQFLLRFIYLFIFAREKRRARGQNSIQVYSFCEKNWGDLQPGALLWCCEGWADKDTKADPERRLWEEKLR